MSKSEVGRTPRSAAGPLASLPVAAYMGQPILAVLMASRPTKGDENPRVCGIFDEPRKAGQGASRGPGVRPTSEGFNLFPPSAGRGAALGHDHDGKLKHAPPIRLDVMRRHLGRRGQA